MHASPPNHNPHEKTAPESGPRGLWSRLTHSVHGNGHKSSPLLLTAAPSTPPSLRTLATIVGVVAVMAVARELLVPLALSGFIALLLNPMVLRLQKWGSARLPAIIAVSMLATAPVVTVLWVVARQFMLVLTTLPEYRENIRTKLESLRGPAGKGFDRLAQLYTDLQTSHDLVPATPPVPVTVIKPPPSVLEAYSLYAGPLVPSITLIGITLVFVVFMLAQWDDLRDRLIRLISAGRLTTTTGALDELSDRIGSFLRIQFLINCGVGVVVGTALYFLKVPNAFLWGFLAAVLRYIPYLGAITAAALPLVLTIATSEGWSQPAQVFMFFVIFEIVINNFVEPYLYGTSTGISATALLVAAIFWGWLWGIPGLLLATPLTVCLVVAGRHVPQLSFLNVMLGDQPVLEPPAKFYQRLVAMDSDQAADVAAAYLKDHTLTQLYDNVALSAVRTAEGEREDGTLDDAHYKFMLQAISEIAEDMARDVAKRRRAEAVAEITDSAPPMDGAAAAARLRDRVAAVDTPPPPLLKVLCIPARDEADAIAAEMFEMLAPSIQAHARALSVEDLGTDLAEIVAEYRPDFILVSGVPPHAATHARSRAKMARRRVPAAPFLAGIWGLGPERSLRSRLEAAGFDGVSGSMEELMGYLKDVMPKTATGVTPAPGAAEGAGNLAVPAPSAASS